MRYHSDTGLNAPQTDQMIVELRKHGYSYRAIGRAGGMDASGVYRAWRRLQAGGQGTRAPRT